jgi:CheY-like chemotaxis protein
MAKPTKVEYSKDQTILIAEDNEVTLTLLQTFLDNYCKKILIAKNGETAVSLVKENPELDIVFMDMKMPILSGFEATQQIREFNKDLIIIAQLLLRLTTKKIKFSR